LYSTLRDQFLARSELLVEITARKDREKLDAETSSAEELSRIDGNAKGCSLDLYPQADFDYAVGGDVEM
jgi:hypothetical protein